MVDYKGCGGGGGGGEREGEEGRKGRKEGRAPRERETRRKKPFGDCRHGRKGTERTVERSRAFLALGEWVLK